MSDPKNKAEPSRTFEAHGPTKEEFELFARVRKKAAANALLTDKERESARKAHAAAISKRNMETAKFRQFAENGSVSRFDQDIAYFLEDLHAGKIKSPSMPECADNPEMDPTSADFVAYPFLRAVADNDHKTIRRISEAVQRVHARASGEGKTFKIAPGNPQHAQLLVRVRKKGVPSTVKETATLAETVGIKNADQKDIRRIHKGLGGKTGKVGRPSKT